MDVSVLLWIYDNKMDDEPTGIIWSKITPDKLRRVPILRKLLKIEEAEGKDVTLKEGAPPPEIKTEDEGEESDRQYRRRPSTAPMLLIIAYSISAKPSPFPILRPAKKKRKTIITMNKAFNVRVMGSLLFLIEMKNMGAVDENTVIITTVHDCQVLDFPESLIEDHDLVVDYIVTQQYLLYQGD
jgi:hypothetical protein